jgi:hypothetical protein
MNHRQSIPDATDEFDVQEVLDMLEVAARARQSSPTSIAPVDFDVVDPPDSSPEAHLVTRRRKLSRYVIGAVAAACAILVVSALRHPSHTDAATAAAAQPRAIRPEPVTVRTHAPAAAPVPANAAPAETAAAGLLRFTAPAGWAWLDGNQLSANSAFVPCGTHQVQIGGEEQHDVVVPCGGEVVVDR